jgi:site-specific recombinase XerC
VDIQKPGKKAPGSSSGTLLWLWTQYRKSPAWLGMKLSTRRQRENIMRHVLATGGHAPIEKFTRGQIIAEREARKDTPSAANHYLATMRGIFEWAVDGERRKTNPCDGVKLPRRPKSNGFPEWDD